MWDYGYNEDATVNLRDSITGVVKGQSRSGLYIDLNIENDFEDYREIVPAFSYWTGRLPVGTRVMCSIKRLAKDNKEVLVNVDSVDYEDEMAA